MVKKFSKCEVKTKTLLKFNSFTGIDTGILREIKFWCIQTVKNVIFGNFRASEF